MRLRRATIRWTDSARILMGWDDLDAYRDKAHPDVIVSTGYVFMDSPEGIGLALSWSPLGSNPHRGTESIADAMFIPRVAIIDVEWIPDVPDA